MEFQTILLDTLALKRGARFVDPTCKLRFYSLIFVQATDVPVLNYLVDIRVFNFENPLGFRLAFTFKQNEHFFDTELTKDYFLKCEPSEDENPLFFEGLFIS